VVYPIIRHTQIISLMIPKKTSWNVCFFWQTMCVRFFEHFFLICSVVWKMVEIVGSSVVVGLHLLKLARPSYIGGGIHVHPYQLNFGVFDEGHHWPTVRDATRGAWFIGVILRVFMGAVVLIWETHRKSTSNGLGMTGRVNWAMFKRLDPHPHTLQERCF